MPTQRIAEFDTWREGYASATVNIHVAGTSSLANVYLDEGLTQAAPNPQILISDGNGRGKFTAPIYCAQPYELHIDSTDQTGAVRPPLYTLAGEDASQAVATADGGSAAFSLASHLARMIDVRDFGEWKDSSDDTADATANTASLMAAIGKAAAAGGGVVHIPAGTFEMNALTLPGDVLVEGRGRDATILQSLVGDKVLTLGGDGAGCRSLTLDGVSLQAGSVGVYSLAQNETVFADMLIRRFVTGLHCQGGRDGLWHRLSIDNCTTGAKLHGDADTSGGGQGDEYRDNRWTGGTVSNCTTIGVDLSFEDRKAWHNQFENVWFQDNTGIAFKLNGARFTEFYDCRWNGNTTALEVTDDDDTDKEEENTVIGLFCRGGSITGGKATLLKTLQDVVFSGMEISDVDFTLTGVLNNVLVRDCIEDSKVTLAGETMKWTRWRQINEGTVSGQTTDATATKAWSTTFVPGQVGYFEAIIVGNQVNGANSAEYHISVSAERPGSQLGYDTQTANFALGKLLTGQTSQAKGRIVADSDSGATGTLTLRSIIGKFQDNEIIKDDGTGSATANGSLVTQDVVLKGSVATLRAAREDVAGWNATFVANGPELELQVTGAADTTIDWEVHVRQVVAD